MLNLQFKQKSYKMLRTTKVTVLQRSVRIGPVVSDKNEIWKANRCRWQQTQSDDNT